MPTTSGTYTASVYVKKGTASTAYIIPVHVGGAFTTTEAEFDLNAQTAVVISGLSGATAKIAEQNDGFFRISVTYALTASVTDHRMRVGMTGAVGDTLIYWGAQLEEGSFPTSYIPTAGTQVTRAADNCVRVLGDEFNQNEFTLFAVFTILGTGDGAIIGTNSSTITPAFLGEGTNEVIIDFREFDGGFYKSGSHIIVGQEYNLAFSWNGEVAKIFLDGALILTTGSTASNLFGTTTLFGLGKQGSGRVINVINKDFQIFPTTLSDAELITLTGGN